MAITIRQIIDGIVTTLKDPDSGSSELKRVLAAQDLQESVSDLPLLEIYPRSGENSRLSMRGAVQQHSITLWLDLYAAKQGVGLGESMGIVLDALDELIDLFQAQNVKPYFGLAGIQAFNWSWEQALIPRNNIEYRGIRFTMIFEVY